MRGLLQAAARAPNLAVTLAAVLLAGAVNAQVLEVHLDGSVVTYDGAEQHMSRGAVPTARVLNAPHARARQYASAKGEVRPTPAPPQAMAEAIHTAAQRHQVDERLVTAVAWRESHFNQNAVSRKGAQGAMQLMPETARRLGVDPYDFNGNIDGGAQYLSSMMHRFGGDQAKALAAYNAGPGAVDRYGGVPPYAETKAYVDSILSHMGGGSSSAVVAAPIVLATRMPAF
jgi:soluble lytic murein transglycosylase-like protein